MPRKCSAAMNPARDFGPRLVALWAGYGTDTFTTGWWIHGPWAGTLSGAGAGATLYDAFVFVGAESPVNYLWADEEGVGGEGEERAQGEEGAWAMAEAGHALRRRASQDQNITVLPHP